MGDVREGKNWGGGLKHGGGGSKSPWGSHFVALSFAM